MYLIKDINKDAKYYYKIILIKVHKYLILKQLTNLEIIILVQLINFIDYMIFYKLDYIVKLKKKMILKIILK